MLLNEWNKALHEYETVKQNEKNQTKIVKGVRDL